MNTDHTFATLYLEELILQQILKTCTQYIKSSLLSYNIELSRYIYSGTDYPIYPLKSCLLTINNSFSGSDLLLPSPLWMKCNPKKITTMAENH